jgi:transposase
VVPDAVTVMDPFHVVALAEAKLDLIRQRVQQRTLARRGHTGDPLYEIAQLGRTLWRRRGDILAFFDHHVSNGPTDAINGRLEALRRNALGFRNITHYRIRSLLHSGALHALVNAL